MTVAILGLPLPKSAAFVWISLYTCYSFMDFGSWIITQWQASNKHRY